MVRKSTVVALGWALALTGRPAYSQEPTRPEPAALNGVGQALANAVDRICPWFLSGKNYSLPTAQKTAFDAGYGRGALTRMAIVFEPGQLATSSLAFHAAMKETPPQNTISLFMGFDPVVCQVQVYGFGDQAETYLMGLEAQGWTKQGTRVVHAPIGVERFQKVVDGRVMTLVVNRWAGEPKPGIFKAIINILPGAEPTRGALK